MLKQFLSTFMIFNLLFVTSGFSQVAKSISETAHQMELRNFTDAEVLDNHDNIEVQHLPEIEVIAPIEKEVTAPIEKEVTAPIEKEVTAPIEKEVKEVIVLPSSTQYSCNYHIGDHNKLKPSKCETNLTDAYIPGIGGVGLRMDFRNPNKNLSTYDDIKSFYKGDKKACLACAGVSKKELNTLKEKLLNDLNSQRGEFGANAFRDAVISNIVAYRDHSSATKSFRLNSARKVMSCRDEFEELISDDSCRDKFLSSAESLFDGELNLDNDQGNGKSIDKFTQFLDDIEKGEMMNVSGRNSKRKLNVFEGVKISDKRMKKITRKLGKNRKRFKEVSNHFSVSNVGDFVTGDDEDRLQSNVGIKLDDIEENFENRKKDFVVKLSKISTKQYEDFCSSDDLTISDDLSRDIRFFDSFSHFRGRINKVSICSVLGNKYKGKESRFSETNLDSSFSVAVKDLESVFKASCQDALKRTKKYVCKDYTEIDQYAFYNEYSSYGAHPFFESYYRASNKEKLAHKAFACVYGPYAYKAQIVDTGDESNDGNGASNSNDFVSTGSFLANMDGKVSVESGLNQFTESSEQITSSNSPQGADEVTDVSSISNFSNQSSGNFPVNTPITSSVFNNDYVKKKNSIAKSNEESEKNDSKGDDRNDARTANSASSNLAQPNRESELNSENNKLKREIEQMKADAAFSEDKQKKLNELEALNDQIAQLKSKKESVQESNSDTLSKKSGAASSLKSAERGIASVEGPTSSAHSDQKITETYQALSNAKNIIEKKQALSTPIARASLDASYKNDLTAILASGTDGNNLDVQVSKIVKDMINNGAISHIQIVEKEGVKVVVFEDQSKEIALDKFTAKTQGLLEEYVSFLNGNKIKEKRKEIIDLDLKNQVAAKYASFIQEFESELESQKE